MRNKCSALYHDLYINHIRIIAQCGNCNMNRAEDANHFFLECHKYAAARQEMLKTFDDLQIPCNTHVILHGSIDHNFETNKTLLDSVYKFIVQTNRF